MQEKSFLSRTILLSNGPEHHLPIDTDSSLFVYSACTPGRWAAFSFVIDGVSNR